MGSCCLIWLSLLRPESRKLQGQGPGGGAGGAVGFSPVGALLRLLSMCALQGDLAVGTSSEDPELLGPASSWGCRGCVCPACLDTAAFSETPQSCGPWWELGLVPALSGLRSFGQPRPRLSSPALEQDEGRIEPRAPAPTARAAKFQIKCIWEGFYKVSDALTTFGTDWAQCIHPNPSLSWGLSKAWDLLGTVLVAS